MYSIAPRSILHSIVAAGAVLVTAHAEEAKPATPATPAAPAAPAAPAKPADAPAAAPVAGKVYAPSDLEALKAVKGQKILLEGKIVAAGANKTQSIRYLNFSRNFRESVSLVFFSNAGGGTFTEAKLAEYVGKTIRVNGVLSEYNGSLQIRMESWDQVKVVETPAAPAPAPAAATPATPAPATPPAAK